MEKSQENLRHMELTANEKSIIFPFRAFLLMSYCYSKSFIFDNKLFAYFKICTFTRTSGNIKVRINIWCSCEEKEKIVK